jgi:hypothetical protein
MAGKSYIKVGAYDWDRIKKMYVKTGGQTWSAIRKAYVKTNNGWKKVFDTTSNRPFIEGNDIPKLRLNTFRTDSTAGSIIDGTADDPINPVVEAPPVQRMGPTQNPPNLDSRTPVTAGWVGNQGIGRHLWGYNGDWVSGNGSAITYAYDWLFSTTGDLNYVEKEFLATSSTGRRDMITNSSTHLGRDDGDYFDKNWLIFRVRATNSAGNASAQSLPVYIVRQRPSGTINVINTGVDVPETLSASITYASYWYNKPDVYDSYVEWFAVDALGDALTTNNRVAIEYLYDIAVTGTTTKSGTVYHYATLENKIYIARLTLNNSNTQAPVVPVIGFIPSSPFTAEDSTSPGSPLSVTTLNILDIYSNAGTDNRGYIPAGGLMKIRSNVTGVDGSTTYRIRYRMYNWQNQSYYGMDGTNYGSAASSAWTTRTGSSTSFGSGGTLISNISVSGTTATLTHNEVVSSSLFGSTTYAIDGVGGYDRWQIEIEVSALKNSIRKYYADVVGGIPYYISRSAANLLLTADPNPARKNQNVTLSGSIGALGGGNSYPRQYRVTFGDGSDSGWLPVNGWSYGTANPTFSIVKQYSAAGEYYPYFQTIPDYSTGSTYVEVTEELTAPTSLTATSDRGDGVLLQWNAVPGANYYEIYWGSSLGGGPVNQSTFADFGQDNSITTNSFLDTTITAGSTRYYRVRARINATASGPNSSDWFPGPGSNGIAGTRIQTLPGLPTSLTATTNRSDGVNLTFSGSSLATGYDIFWNTNEISNPSDSATPDFTNVSSPFLDTTISVSATRWYWVRGRNANGTGPWFPISNGVIGTRVGVAPNGGTVTVTPSTGTAGSTTFTASPSGWTGSGTISYTYSWQRFTNGSFVYEQLGTGTTFSPTVAQRNTALAWQVVITASNGISPNGTASVGFTVNAPVSKLATPTGVNATDTRTDGVNITWNAVSGAAYYGIWYGPTPGYDSSPDFGGPNNPTLITGTSYLDTAISAGSNRNYYVQAFASGNPTGSKSDWGGPDNGARITAPVKLATPTGVSASDNRSDGINITWNPVSGASYYGVWWGGAPGYDNSPDFPNIFATSYFDSGAPVGSRNYYVQAFASGNPTGTKSDWGGPDSGTRTSVPVVSAPAAPTGVGTSGSGLVSWNASSGATSYTVEYYTATNSSGANQSGPYYGFPGSSTSFQISYPVVNSVLQNWARARVSASNAGGTSSYSSFGPASGFA